MKKYDYIAVSDLQRGRIIIYLLKQLNTYTGSECPIFLARAAFIESVTDFTNKLCGWIEEQE